MTQKKQYITPETKTYQLTTISMMAGSLSDRPQSTEVHAINMESKSNSSFDTPKSVWDD